VTEMPIEMRILRMMKKVLTDVAKDTNTPPELKHPLSEDTIYGIKECLALISAREIELQTENGGTSTARPFMKGDPQKNVVVSIKPKPKPTDADKKD